MYSFTGSSYGQGSNGRFPSSNNNQPPNASNPLSGFFSATNSFVSSPLTNRHVISSGFSGQHSQPSQVVSQSPFYIPSQQTSSICSSEHGSPSTPISPQESLLRTEGDKSSNAYFDLSPSYMNTPKTKAYSSHNPSVTTSYFNPSFPFPSPSNMSTGSPIYNPSCSIYNQYADPLTGAEHHLPNHGINPYPVLPNPYMANRVSPKSVSKLSYDNPRFKLTPEKAVLLIKWFDEHKEHPYPTRHEKILLCQQTQLTFTQVSTWFANARRRMKKASLEEEEIKSSSASCSSPECSVAESPERASESNVIIESEATFTNGEHQELASSLTNDETEESLWSRQIC